MEKHWKLYYAVHSEAFPAIKQSDLLEVSIRGQQRVESISLGRGDSVKILSHNKLETLSFNFYLMV